MAVHMRNFSIAASDTPDDVNVSCMVLLFVGAIVDYPDWGKCNCAVCTSYRIDRGKAPEPGDAGLDAPAALHRS